jgi:hypothetical protein
MFNLYFLFNVQLMYVNLFSYVYNPITIVVLRVISEVLGVFRYMPICLLCKIIIDIGVREPLNICMYSNISFNVRRIV